jgi:hypothetical protein
MARHHYPLVTEGLGHEAREGTTVLKGRDQRIIELIATVVKIIPGASEILKSTSDFSGQKALKLSNDKFHDNNQF